MMLLESREEVQIGSLAIMLNGMLTFQWTCKLLLNSLGI